MLKALDLICYFYITLLSTQPLIQIRKRTTIKAIEKRPRRTIRSKNRAVQPQGIAESQRYEKRHYPSPAQKHHQESGEGEWPAKGRDREPAEAERPPARLAGPEPAEEVTFGHQDAARDQQESDEAHAGHEGVE